MKKVNLILTVVTIIFLLQGIIFSKADSFTEIKFYGEAANDRFGTSVSNAGDLNGDGYDDIVIGSPNHNSYKGKIYIYLGGTLVSQNPNYTINGEYEGNYFGLSVSSAGDVNHDGFGDLIVGAWGYSDSVQNYGRAYIYFGGTNFDITADVIITGDPNEELGRVVSCAGDVNGDGFSDVIIGCPGYFVSPVFGRANIYFGGANMNNIKDISLNSLYPSGYAYNAVASAGDLNGDGFSDVIVGATGINSGRAYIYYGGANMNNYEDLILYGVDAMGFGWSVSGTDFNDDGFSDAIAGSPGSAFVFKGGANMDNTYDFRFRGNYTNGNVGLSLSDAGDVNGDQYNDFIIGGPIKSEVFIYYGGQNPDTAYDIMKSGESSIDQYGWSVSKAGDVNDDGLEDFIVGAPHSQYSGYLAGSAYLYISNGPVIRSVTPKQNAINVNKSSDITVNFSHSMNASTINSNNIKLFGFETGKLSAAVSYNAGTKTATINPNSDFKAGEKISITLSSGIQTLTNTSITPFTWTFTVQASGGTGVFRETVIDTAGAGVIGGMDLLCGDFNGDNKNDIAAINYGGDAYIYTNTGSANFSVTQIISVSGLSVGGGLTAGDFDSDGDPDLLMSFYDPAEQFFVYRNNGNGHFTLSSSGSPGIYYCETADLDRDGDLDVVGMWYGTELRYLINDGTGNFTPHSIPGKDFTREICDVENDGDMDIICANGVIGSATGITVLINDGNANFSAGNTSAGSSIVLYSSAQDYDSDGDMDIINNGAIYLNDGSGNFSYSSSPGIGFTLVSGDFDADGDIDIAFTENDIDDIEIFKNNSSAVFTTSQVVSVGDSPGWSTSCDFDEDGDIDIAVGNYHGHSGQTDISVLLNDQNCSPPSAALSGSLAIPVNSANSVFTSSNENGYWDIANFDSTQASIPPYSEGDSVVVSAGNQLGHFILYFIAHNQCGDTVLFAKHGYVENPASPSNFSLGLITEGFLNTSTNQLSEKDTIDVYLRNIIAPYELVDSVKTVLDSVSFTTQSSFQNAPTGTYYIVLKHRNSLETWSKSGGKLFVRGMTSFYDFSSSQYQAFGNNLIFKNGYYCLYSGDVNQDGAIDLSDLELIDNDLQNYSSGYIPTDVNGDGGVDISDMTIAENNSINFVTVRNPIVGDGLESKLSKESKESKLNKLSMLNKDAKNLTDAPEKFELKDNFPNPFNPTTNIKYDLPKSGYVSLKIFDITGREVASLVNENQNAGKYSVQWNASEFSSGTYFYKIVSGKFTQVKRMILVK